MIGYFNRSHSEIDGSWEYYRYFFVLEIPVIIFNVLYFIFWVKVMVTSGSVHRNSILLNVVYYLNYIIQNFFWILQPIIIIWEINNDKLKSQLFYIMGSVRTVGLTQAFFQLPSMVIERSFATFLVKDYERNPNKLIGNGILITELIVTFISGIYYIVNPTVYNIVIIIFINVAAFLLNKYNEKVNLRLYNSRSSLELSERFQISENIKTIKMFTTIVYWIGFFNVIVNICLVLDNFDIPIGYRNFSSVIFDIAVFTYGITAPIIAYRNTKSWQIRVAVILGRFKKPQIHPLKDTFGHDMTTKDPSAAYFNIYKTQWN